MARTLASAFLIVLFLPGCADSIAPPEKLALPTPTKQPVSFNEDIHPILKAKLSWW